MKISLKIFVLYWFLCLEDWILPHKPNFRNCNKHWAARVVVTPRGNPNTIKWFTTGFSDMSTF